MFLPNPLISDPEYATRLVLVDRSLAALP